ncbi:pseudaminic acid cytidylyltransferase [Roseinatronobacter alkalisoli]|uniref:Pseudaminic acid cytidylyltransferase n=1 Tax=Roseinatronobacter alkalisoli TaxID=3028235 RepID=A0ABT5T6A7_9RHOB|nr:pseudaminic acid cytidylyltransferase [Roseinatronobacter sp. HJB301]MDD7970645.1 pseudaminic acid cytidylyltransferase [Roseinatronobacter sp. HJB301]
MKVAIIPARGGSKRIPRKNIRSFAGQPMIAHSIDAARAADVFDAILVSTDDPEIAQVAREYGAEVPFTRPAALSDDHATSIAVIAHAVDWLRAAGRPPQDVCCLYATAPFVRPQDLRDGLAMLHATGATFCFPVTSFAFPIQRALARDDSGAVTMLHPEHEITRSQDLAEYVHDAGQFYWGHAQAWVDGLPIYAAHSRTILMPRHRVQDIDTPEDWTRAELMHLALARSTPKE